MTGYPVRPGGGDRWRGTKDLVEGKLHWHIQSNKIVVTTDYQGPYLRCLSNAPKIGKGITGIGNGVKVTELRITELDGEAGRIDVTLEAEQPTTATEYGTEILGEPIFEMEWMELQKPLEAHPEVGTLGSARPKYDSNGVLSPTGKQRTWDDWSALKANDYNETGSVSLADYKSYRENGVDSFLVYQPVARRTSHYLGGVTVTRCGVRQTPPSGTGAPSGYQWLKTADRLTREGRKRTRVEEWTGAEEWNTTLYPAA